MVPSTLRATSFAFLVLALCACGPRYAAANGDGDDGADANNNSSSLQLLRGGDAATPAPAPGGAAADGDPWHKNGLNVVAATLGGVCGLVLVGYAVCAVCGTSANRVENGDGDGGQGTGEKPGKKKKDRRWSSLFPRPMWQAPYRGYN